MLLAKALRLDPSVPAVNWQHFQWEQQEAIVAGENTEARGLVSGF